MTLSMQNKSRSLFSSAKIDPDKLFSHASDLIFQENNPITRPFILMKEKSFHLCCSTLAGSPKKNSSYKPTDKRIFRFLIHFALFRFIRPALGLQLYSETHEIEKNEKKKEKRVSGSRLENRITRLAMLVAKLLMTRGPFVQLPDNHRLSQKLRGDINVSNSRGAGAFSGSVCYTFREILSVFADRSSVSLTHAEFRGKKDCRIIARSCPALLDAQHNEIPQRFAANCLVFPACKWLYFSRHSPEFPDECFQANFLAAWYHV